MNEYFNWDEHPFSWDNVVWFKLDLHALQGYAIAVFAYTCVTNIFIVKLSLTNAIERRMKKVNFNYIFFMYSP